MAGYMRSESIKVICYMESDMPKLTRGLVYRWKKTYTDERDAPSTSKQVITRLDTSHQTRMPN
ncbi:hypothetical protein MTR_6g092715 [Medicago truncatula]|uniref:Uncharacterized protein n=1 Tax=Medicago truncatula TaxID=3880 RepID=A0A072UCB7_MEDTR|nr:hypothetical protein MTR_6g092715 [Medicago truncatula]